MNTQNNRRIWTIVGIIAIALFFIAFFAPPSANISQRNSTSSNSNNTIYQLFIALAPTAIIVWLLWRMMRKAKPGLNDAMSMGKNRFHKLMPTESILTFQDIGGTENAKAELKEIARFLKEPQTFAALGTRPPCVLLTGAPGTGKTLVAKALCKETGFPLFYTSGSEFVEMFVGIGASRIRDLFEAAKKQAPSIVFVDALDTIGRRREAVLANTQSEYEQTLQQLLTELDSVKPDSRIVVVAATNRPDLLDPALIRSGRLERQINLDAPNAEDREAILKVHTRGKPIAADINWKQLANSSTGFVGADLERLVNEAALMAGKNGKQTIGMSEFESAIQLVKQNSGNTQAGQTSG